jgi:hypothetical protein
MNFGEELAYWYLRLNGFFPLPNFALHRYDKEHKLYADADLLAVRWPHVYEEIGGQDCDWDSERFDTWGLNLRNGVTGLIVEVKTGEYSSKDIATAFHKDRLLYAVRRLGFWNEEGAKTAVEALSSSSTYSASNMTVGKLLIAVTPSDGAPPVAYRSLDLSDVEKFIIERMQKYKDPKWASRFFFPSDLMQYLIWDRKKVRKE